MLKRRILNSTILILFSVIMSGQDQQVIDSLENVLKNTKNEEEKILLYKQLADEYFDTDQEKSRYYISKIYDLSKVSGNKEGIIIALNRFGYMHYKEGGYDSALYNFMLAKANLKEENFLKEHFFSYRWMGSVYLELGNFDSAYYYLHECSRYAELINEKDHLVSAYTGMGIYYYNKGDNLTTLKYFFKSDSLLGDKISKIHGDLFRTISIVYHVLDDSKLEKKYLEKAHFIYNKLHDEYGLNLVNMGMGTMEFYEGNYEVAEEYLLKTIPYFTEQKDLQKLGEIYGYLGQVTLAMEKYSQAENYLKKVTGEFRSSCDPIIVRGAYTDFGALNLALNKPSEAIPAYNKAFELAGYDMELKSEILNGLAMAYSMLGNHKRAFELLQEYIVISDSVNDIFNSETIREIEAKYENEKKEREIALLETQKQLNEKEAHNQRLIFTAALALFLLLSAILYYLFRIKNKANRKLKEIDRIRSRFFTNISHEFRTPLTLIAGPIENKLASQNVSREERSQLELIHGNTKRLVNLVDQMLDISKIESGAFKLHAEEADVYVFLNNLAESYAYQAGQNEIDYQVAIDKVHCLIRFDPDVLHKIINNLFSNAFKYTPRKGTIRFEAQVLDGRLVMSLENTGNGIPKEKLDKVFDRYFQGNDNSDGAGIGLSLVKELVDHINGKITVTSDKDKPTVFRLTLPVSKGGFMSSKAGNREIKTNLINRQNEITLSKVNGTDSDNADQFTEQPILLIVEDNADVRKYIKSILEEQFRIIEAEDGETGIQLAVKWVPDFIISDIMMPAKNGIELCSTLKNDERTSHIPIILLTAKAGEENIIEGLETGADDYIVKPFSNKVLRTRIDNLLAIRKKFHEHYSRDLVLKLDSLKIDSPDKKFIDKIQKILNEKITDSALTADIFSKEIGMSRMQLHRKLKALTGHSTTAFVRNERLKLAARLLENSGANISEIGYNVGFSDPSYFTKCFRETFGCAPSEFPVQKTRLRS